MPDKYNLEQIRQFWTQQAVQHGASSDASWSDRMMIELEIQQVLNYLNDGDHLLDIGCANGYSTVHFAQQKRVQIRGLDYIPEMIEQARQRISHEAIDLKGTIEFDIGDITSLKEPNETYDKVVVVRVLINLREWSYQLKALNECARVLKPGGLLLLSEATLQGWRQMNRMRQEWELTEIPIPPFNEYLDQDQVIQSVAPELELVELVNFSSTYFVGTRVLKPLLIQALGTTIDAANPAAEWNRWFAQLPAWGDYGTQKLFVFRKR